MSISDDLTRQAIYQIASVEGLTMDPDALADDVMLLTHAWSDESDFQAAVVNTCTALRLLIGGSVDDSGLLKYDHQGWHSYHYQHKRAQGVKADMRIMFRHIESGIEVKGFGDRRVPQDFYRHMAYTRKEG